MKHKRNIEQDIAQFERMEAIKPSMKCGNYDEYSSVETDDPIQAQLEVWKSK
jgi:hypothetical protein